MTASKNIHEDMAEQKLKEAVGKEMPFKVPDGYFDTLPEQMLAKCKESDKVVVRAFYNRPMFRAMAAAAAILIVAFVINFMLIDAPAETESYTDYTLQEVYEYNFSNLAELEEAYLLSFIEDETIEELFLEETNEVDISDEDIIDYLLAENHIEYLIINDY